MRIDVGVCDVAADTIDPRLPCAFCAAWARLLAWFVKV